MGTLDVVTEREECVRAKGNISVLGYPCLLLFCGQNLWFLGEEQLPCSVTQYVLVFLADVYINGVVAVCTPDAWFERKVHNLRALAQPPYVCFLSSQTCAVDAALLSCTDTDGLSVLDIAYRVALGVLKGYKCDN